MKKGEVVEGRQCHDQICFSSELLMHGFFDTTLYSVQLSSLLWLLIGFIAVLQKMGNIFMKPR